MKAIVANVLFGGIFGCLSYANSTQANPVPAPSADAGQIISSRLSSTKVTTITPEFNSNLNLERYHQQFQYNISASVSRIQPNNYPARQISLTNDCISCNSDRVNKRPPSLADRPYVHKSIKSELQLGFQSTFWSSTSKKKYWGVTTIEHWGNDSERISLPKLDYISSAPTLGSGSSLLTFSGGGDRNLALPVVLDRENTAGEFEQFRGGIAYHHGFFSQLTMGVGVVYEDNLAGFTQLTYDSDILPLKTTVSLLLRSNVDNVEVRSHIRLQPAQNFVFNFHSDAKQQKFDADWAIYPGFNIVAKANSKNRRYSTGFKIALQNNYFSLNASATINSEQNLQWNLSSQIGRLKFSHKSDRHESNSEVSNPIFNSTNLGFGCSAFVRYQTQQTKDGQQEFLVWGGRINSQTKVSPNKHQWSIDLSYGNSDRGKGLIANGSVALKPDLFLKLNYQEISAVSDRTNIKLQLSSN